MHSNKGVGPLGQQLILSSLKVRLLQSYYIGYRQILLELLWVAPLVVGRTMGTLR